MRAQWIHSRQVLAAPDWRPAFHFSGAAWLNERAHDWPPLGASGDCLDGWRVSMNPGSRAYDPLVEQAPVYRLRHVEPMDLRTEAEHWKSPLLAGQPFCVQPGDLVVRRVGSVAAALVSALHRRHPVDANLGIIRLKAQGPGQVLWTAYCLNQPHYRDYLEASATVTDLVRVGLRALAEMPIAPKPEGLDTLAEHYADALNRYAQSFEQLFRLRRQVSDWTLALLPDLAPFMDEGLTARRWTWFAPEDLGDQLSIATAEQRQAARTLAQTGLTAPLGRLAQISPREPRVTKPQGCLALRIGDLDQHLGIAEHLSSRTDLAWRTQTRALTQFDVLVSTFVGEPKVAFVPEPVGDCILPSEQLVTLCFHRAQGAYALLMESALVRAQWSRLATGQVQRFVPPGAVGQVVLPVPEQDLAETWHAALVDLMAKRRESRGRMEEVLAQVAQLYDAIHPAIGARA